MKFEIEQKGNKYVLKLEGRLVYSDKFLSSIMAKVEQYVKLRFLPAETNSFKDKLGGLFK